MKVKNQEKSVNSAFSKKSLVYEDYGKSNEIVTWSRNQVYDHLNLFLSKNSDILELNGGTGEDALHLATNGHKVHIVELADGMISKIKEKIDLIDDPGEISYQQMSYLNLNNVSGGPYDHVFSNFGGLNLTPNLSKIFKHLSKLVKPKGFVTVVMLSRISIWELSTFLWNRKTALRRIPSIFHHPVVSNISGEKVLTYYFSPKQVSEAFDLSFKLVHFRGLCSLVPPSYFETFPTKHSKLFSWLKTLETKWGHLQPISNVGDFFIATYQYLPEVDN